MISEDKKTVVECGNTDPKKVFDTFLETNIHEKFVQIPYMKRSLNDIPILYIFEITKEGLEILTKKKKEVLEELHEEIRSNNNSLAKAMQNLKLIENSIGESIQIEVKDIIDFKPKEINYDDYTIIGEIDDEEVSLNLMSIIRILN